MGVNNILWPSGIEAVSRQIFYDYSSNIVKRVVKQNIVLHNNTGKSVDEIMIEIEGYKNNLTVLDEYRNELAYLTKTEIDKKNIDETIKDGIKNNKIFVLYLKLNRTAENNSYIRVQLNYVEYKSKNKPKLTKISSNTTFYETIKFYGNETLSVFNRWEQGIDIENPEIYWLVGKEYITFDQTFAHYKRNENCFSYSISVDTRIKNNISGCFNISKVEPEKWKLNLIKVLLLFTLGFPFSMLIAAYKGNINYLFDSLEVEVVLILTLAFSETKTTLIKFARYLVLAIIITIVLFCGVMFYIL